MRQRFNQTNPWPALVLFAAIPRVFGALYLPNAFGDAYIYIRDIGLMSTKMRAEAFAITDLYGFWLPLYQFISALVNVFVGNGFYSGKLVAAIFGVGVCLLVYQVTMQLTADRTVSLLAFALIALNPLHIFYSASAMTDVPHAFFVLASLYFCFQGSWVFPAVMAALAGLTRMESWMFIALIPTIQFLRDRRVSILALVILVTPPLFWFYISWKATGSWHSSLTERRQYHDWLLNANPTLAHFSLPQVLRDGATLLVSADIAVLLSAIGAGWIVCRIIFQKEGGRTIHEITRSEQSSSLPVLSAVSFDFVDWRLASALIFFFAFFGLIVVAYLTGTQPMIFPRYGLILFTLCIPVLAWAFSTLKKQRPLWTRRFLLAVIVICAFDASVEFVGSVGLFNQISAQRAVADYLRDHFDRGSNARIFCDDGTVQVMSGISTEKFVTSSEAPRDREAFLNYLQEKNVEFLVFVSNQDSTLVRLFPDRDYGDRIRLFEPVMNSHTDFLYTSIWLYRLHAESVK